MSKKGKSAPKRETPIGISREKALRVLKRVQECVQAKQPLGITLRTDVYRYRQALVLRPEWNLPPLPPIPVGGNRKGLQLAPESVHCSPDVLEEARRWKLFKSLFGNYSYTNDFELMTALQKEGFEVGTPKDIYDELVKGFERFSNTNPKLGLGKLEFRNYREPVNLAFNPDVREHFADVAFDLNTLTRHNYDGLVVTGAQFNTYSEAMLQTLQKVWLPFMEREAGRRYALVVQVMAFGPINTHEIKRLVQQPDGSVSTEKKRVPKGYFDTPLKGHILLPPPGSDMVRFGRATLFNPRILLTNQRATTELMVDTAQDLPGDLIILPFPRYELEHRPHPGLFAGDTFPKMIMTSMSVTQPNYKIDALGMPSARGTSAVKDHDYGAIAITFDQDGTPFPRELMDVEGNGTFHDVVRMPDGSLKIYKFTPQGVSYVGSRDCYSIVEPDWHTGYGTAPLRQAWYGEDGLVPTLRPRYSFAHDFVNMTSINPFRQVQMGRTMYDNWQRWRVIRDKLGFPEDIDRYLERKDVWISYLANAEAELQLCGAELVWRSRMAPSTQQVLVASNHPAWLRREMNQASTGATDPQNTLLLRKLQQDMQDVMRHKTTDIANTVEGDAAWHYLRGWLAAQRSALGLAPEQFRLLERKESWIGPEKAARKFQFADHGDDRRRKAGSTGKRKLHGMRAQHGDKHSGASHRGNWVSGVMVPVQHYVEEPALAWSHNGMLTFTNGQVMNLHVRPDGAYFV